MKGVKFRRGKDAKKSDKKPPPSELSAAAPILGKRAAGAQPRTAPPSKVAAPEVEERRPLDGGATSGPVTGERNSPAKKQRVAGPAGEPAAAPAETREQDGAQAAEAHLPARRGRKSRASLGAAVAQAVAAAEASRLPDYAGSEEPDPPFHEGLTEVLEDKRLVQLLRHICRHEQATIDATFKDHQFLATAAETVLRSWVRKVRELLKQDPTIVDTTQSIVAADADAETEGPEEDGDQEEERREALLTLRSSFLSEEKAWQRLIEAQNGVLQRDEDTRKERPRPDTQAVETAGVDAAVEETRRKLAFQAEALCQLVSGVSDVCRRAEQASKDLAQDFSARFTAILPQGSPRTLIGRFMSYHHVAEPS